MYNLLWHSQDSNEIVYIEFNVSLLQHIEIKCVTKHFGLEMLRDEIFRGWRVESGHGIHNRSVTVTFSAMKG